MKIYSSPIIPPPSSLKSSVNKGSRAVQFAGVSNAKRNRYFSLRKFFMTMSFLTLFSGIPYNTSSINFFSKKAENTEILKGIYQDVFTPEFIESLEVKAFRNKYGAIYTAFDQPSLDKLRDKLNEQGDRPVEHHHPIDPSKAYVSSWGGFGALRGGGRTHQGVDLMPKGVSETKKPKNPILINSPVDGIVIKVKKQPDNNNDPNISNAVKILGYDGRCYYLVHMANASDYPNAAKVDLPEVGSLLSAGDPIGYLGKTGETSIWHLHLEVATEKERAEQEKDPASKQMANGNNYTRIEGQVNPLDISEAGPIAKLLQALPYGRK